MARWIPPRGAPFSEYLDICTFLIEVGTPPLYTYPLSLAPQAITSWALLQCDCPGDIAPSHSLAMTMSDILIEAFTLSPMADGSGEYGVGFASAEQGLYVKGRVV